MTSSEQKQESKSLKTSSEQKTTQLYKHTLCFCTNVHRDKLLNINLSATDPTEVNLKAFKLTGITANTFYSTIKYEHKDKYVMSAKNITLTSGDSECLTVWLRALSHRYCYNTHESEDDKDFLSLGKHDIATRGDKLDVFNDNVDIPQYCFASIFDYKSLYAYLDNTTEVSYKKEIRPQKTVHLNAKDQFEKVRYDDGGEDGYLHYKLIDRVVNVTCTCSGSDRTEVCDCVMTFTEPAGSIDYANSYHDQLNSGSLCSTLFSACEYFYHQKHMLKAVKEADTKKLGVNVEVLSLIAIDEDSFEDETEDK